MTSAKTDGDVGNRHILGLARAVRDHDTPTSAKGILGGLNSFGDRADLVDLEKQSVACLGVNRLLDESWVGNGQIITVAQRVRPRNTRRSAF